MCVLGWGVCACVCVVGFCCRAYLLTQLSCSWGSRGHLTVKMIAPHALQWNAGLVLALVLCSYKHLVYFYFILLFFIADSASTLWLSSWEEAFHPNSRRLWQKELKVRPPYEGSSFWPLVSFSFGLEATSTWWRGSRTPMILWCSGTSTPGRASHGK